MNKKQYEATVRALIGDDASEVRVYALNSCEAYKLIKAKYEVFAVTWPRELPREEWDMEGSEK